MLDKDLIAHLSYLILLKIHPNYVNFDSQNNKHYQRIVHAMHYQLLVVALLHKQHDRSKFYHKNSFLVSGNSFLERSRSLSLTFSRETPANGFFELMNEFQTI
jgi:hypothetical protein